MPIDPRQFHQVFFEESLEGLESMEAELLGASPGEFELETINAIFRVAHTIKGGAATFGFSEVAQFAHRVENLLAEVREGHRMLDAEAVDLLLQCVDQLRAMVLADRDEQPFDGTDRSKVARRLEAALANSAAPGAETPSGPVAETESAPAREPVAPTESAPAPVRPQEQDAAPAATIAGASPDAVTEPPEAVAPAPGQGWSIQFRPGRGILQQGNDVVLMFRELAELGSLEVQAEPDRLPAFDDLDPEACYLAWRLRLEGAAGEAAVREVFEWVEDESDLLLEPLDEAPNESVSDPHTASTSEPGIGPARDEPVRQPVPGEQSAVRGARTDGASRSESIRVSTEKVDQLLNLVGELVITQAMLNQLGKQLDGPIAERFGAGLDQLDRHTRELQDGVMRMRMLPIAFVFNRFPRMVHDVSSRLGKEVDLELHGEGTEIDKTVMEAIGDPLMHLVRNAIDHGIEEAEVRRQCGKPARGRIALSAYHRGGSIFVEVADDGAGIDTQAVADKARADGLTTTSGMPTPEQLNDLLFRAGFSTAGEVSDLSGRGVGLDVVSRNVRRLGGAVGIHSVPGSGTRFTIRLPLTLAILDAQLIRVEGEVYVVPIEAIVETVPFEPDRLNDVAGRTRLYKLRDDYIPVHRLTDLFAEGNVDTSNERRLLLVVESDGHLLGLVVDELLNQQQVVIKSLEANFWKVEGIAAATILGDGNVGLILDISGLAALATRPSPSPAIQTPAASERL